MLQKCHFFSYITEFEFAELIDHREVKEKQNAFLSETLLTSRNLSTWTWVLEYQIQMWSFFWSIISFIRFFNSVIDWKIVPCKIPILLRKEKFCWAVVVTVSQSLYKVAFTFWITYNLNPSTDVGFQFIGEKEF